MWAAASSPRRDEGSVVSSVGLFRRACADDDGPRSPTSRPRRRPCSSRRRGRASRSRRGRPSRCPCRAARGGGGWGDGERRRVNGKRTQRPPPPGAREANRGERMTQARDARRDDKTAQRRARRRRNAQRGRQARGARGDDTGTRRAPQRREPRLLARLRVRDGVVARVPAVAVRVVPARGRDGRVASGRGGRLHDGDE